MDKIKKVKWIWEFECYVPLCPYCNELAYETDHCVFCGKEYKWVDKSKDRRVTVGEYTVVQASNNHITIVKDDRMVSHASCTKRKSKRQLKKMVEHYEKLVSDKSICDAILNDTNATKPFKCDNGHVYALPKNHCVFCEHCTDIYYDYSNGPYMFCCDIGCGNYETCGNFKEEAADETN